MENNRATGIDQLLQAANIMQSQEEVQNISESQIDPVVNTELLKLNNKLTSRYKLPLANGDDTHLDIKNRIAVLHHTITTIENLKNSKEQLYRKIEDRKPFIKNYHNNNDSNQAQNNLVYDTESDEESRQFKQKFHDQKLQNPTNPFRIIFVEND